MEKEELISFRISKELKENLIKMAKAEDVPVSQLLRKMIKNKTEQFVAIQTKGKNNGR